MVVFDITPIGKPRMTRSDAWKGRKTVLDYWAFKDKLVLAARKSKFELSPVIEVVFFIPMPDSWSKKKKALMFKKPHQQKPDVDNIIKGVFDCLAEDDSFVYSIKAEKYWADKGQIIFKFPTTLGAIFA